MLGIETKCLSADRTGILVGKCIHVYKGFYKKANAVVGDRILISVRKTVAAKSVKKKISQAVVIRAKCWDGRLSGSFVRFAENSFVTFEEGLAYKGPFVRGPVSAKLLYNYFKDVNFLAVAVV